jgi:hypothetical protein
MKTYPDYTDILLHNGHFLSQIFKVKTSKTEFHFYHILHTIFHFDMSHHEQNTVTTRNLAFFELFVQKETFADALFNRYSVITQFAKLAAGEQLCRRCTHRKL